MSEEQQEKKPIYKKWEYYTITLLLSVLGVDNFSDAQILAISIIKEPERSIKIDSIHCSRIDNLDTIKVSTVDLKHYFDDMKDHVSTSIAASNKTQNDKIWLLQKNIEDQLDGMIIFNPYAVAKVQDTQPAAFQHLTQK